MSKIISNHIITNSNPIFIFVIRKPKNLWVNLIKMQILENNFFVHSFMMQVRRVMKISSLYRYRIVLAISQTQHKTWFHSLIFNIIYLCILIYYEVVLWVFTIFIPTRQYYYQTIWPEVHFDYSTVFIRGHV